jgi:hypothetical protein
MSTVIQYIVQEGISVCSQWHRYTTGIVYCSGRHAGMCTRGLFFIEACRYVLSGIWFLSTAVMCTVVY